MANRNRLFQFTFFLFFLFVLISGCGVEPEPFDGRRAYIGIEVYTTFEELMPPGLHADQVYATTSYGSPWSPDGGGVPAVVVGIEDCRLKVNDTSIPDNDETWPDDPEHLVRDIHSDGYHWYKSQDPVTVYRQLNTYASTLSPISLTIDLPSEDNYHYPGGYPRVQATIPFSDFVFEQQYPTLPVAVGDTLHYSWNRAFEPNVSWGFRGDPDEGRLILSYSTGGNPGVMSFVDTLAVDLTTNRLDIVVEDHRIDESDMALQVRFQLTTSFDSRTIDIVSGKQAWVDLREVREYVKDYQLE